MGELIVDKEFDNTQVVSVEPAGTTIGREGKETTVVKLADRADHQATISGAEVTLHDGVPLLTVRVDRANQSDCKEFEVRSSMETISRLLESKSPWRKGERRAEARR